MNPHPMRLRSKAQNLLQLASHDGKDVVICEAKDIVVLSAAQKAAQQIFRGWSALWEFAVY